MASCRDAHVELQQRIEALEDDVTIGFIQDLLEELARAPPTSQPPVASAAAAVATAGTCSSKVSAGFLAGAPTLQPVKLHPAAAVAADAALEHLRCRACTERASGPPRPPRCPGSEARACCFPVGQLRPARSTDVRRRRSATGDWSASSLLGWPVLSGGFLCQSEPGACWSGTDLVNPSCFGEPETPWRDMLCPQARRRSKPVVDSSVL